MNDLCDGHPELFAVILFNNGRLLPQMSQWFFNEFGHRPYVPAAREPTADNSLVQRLPCTIRFRLTLNLSHLLVAGGLPGGGHWNVP